jgi:capsular polysaccharide biosynthesis protein
MNEYEDKIELMNYLNVLWKRKWIIIIVTFLFISAAIVTSFLLPPEWEVGKIFVPSKLVIQTQGGKLQVFPFVKAHATAKIINQGEYNNIIATKLGLDIQDFPILKAEKLKDSYWVRVFIKEIKEKEIEKAKLILHSLCDQLKRELSKMVDAEIIRIDSQINSKEIEKSILEEEINAYKNKLNIIRHRENEIINLEIKDKEMRINQIENEIIDLNEIKGGIYKAKLIKEPTASISPIYSKKLFKVLVAASLGFIISIMLIIFLEYLEKQKIKSKG